MIESIWLYTVKPERAQEFEKQYAADGEWARLFRRAPGFRGTRLLRGVNADQQYVTIDARESLDALNSFRKTFALDYEELDRVCGALTINEQHAGVFTALAPD